MIIKKIVLLVSVFTTIDMVSNLETNHGKNTIIKYQNWLAKNPNEHKAIYNLAQTFFSNKQFLEAIIYYKKAIFLNYKNAEVYHNLGIALMKQQYPLSETLKCFDQAIKLDPNYTESYLKRAIIHEEQKDIAAAIEDYKKAISLNYKLLTERESLARLLCSQEMYEAAIEVYKNAISLNPKNLKLLFNLAYIYCMVGKTKQAIDIYKIMLKVLPNNTPALYNIGFSEKIQGNLEKTITIYKKILETNPGHEATLYGLALTYLYKGDFKKGWDQYEWRLKQEKRNAEKLRYCLQSNTIAGKTFYLFPEGGLGDTIQFIRYAEILHKMGATIIVSLPKALIPLFSNCEYTDTLITRNSTSIKYHDKASIMSLPAIFRSTEENIPKNIPYIKPKTELEAKWKKYFENNRNFKIGICWEADVKNDTSRLPIARRSIPLIQLAKLSNFKNTTFYSLQKSDGSIQLKNLPENFIVQDFGPDFDQSSGSFMDSAAIIKQLDLVITVDTSIAHLAGSLGAPVWIMLPYNTDWRWTINRTTSLWYPSMTIFKQPAPFDWDSVIQKIYNLLENNLEKFEKKNYEKSHV